MTRTDRADAALPLDRAWRGEDPAHATIVGR